MLEPFYAQEDGALEASITSYIDSVRQDIEAEEESSECYCLQKNICVIL